MKVEFVVLADAAQVVGGKLYLLGGGWNVYRATLFPAAAQLAFATSILLESKEIGKRHPVKLTLAPQKNRGRPLVMMEAEVEVGRPPMGSEKSPQRALLAINCTVQFPEPGFYVLTVVAGRSEGIASLEAVSAGKTFELTSVAPST